MIIARLIGLIAVLIFITSCKKGDSGIYGKWSGGGGTIIFSRDGSYVWQEKDAVESGVFKLNLPDGEIELDRTNNKPWIGKASFPTENDLLLKLPRSVDASSDDDFFKFLFSRAKA